MFREAQKNLQTLLSEEYQEDFATYLEGLSPHSETKYSLWKATKYLKRPQPHVPPTRKPNGEWAKSNEENATIFANHLEQVFTSNPCNLQTTLQNIDSVSSRTFEIKLRQVRYVIHNHIDIKRSPGHDKINGRMIK